jgi:hypothetical protein
MGDLNELYDKYFAFMIDQCDKRSKSRGFSMMYDMTDAGLSNVEMVSAKARLNNAIGRSRPPDATQNSARKQAWCS